MKRHDGKAHGAHFGSLLERTSQRIIRQQAVVDGLDPGTDEHRVAANLMLLLQDAMALLIEVRVTVEKRQNCDQGTA